MLYPTTYIDPANRDQDGMYPIDSGSQLMFTFTVPYMGKQTITLKHAMPNSEDWSVTCWISSGSQYTPVSLTGDNTYDFRLDRSDKVLEIWASGGEPEGAIALDPTQTYYLTALNCQNKLNGIQVTFSA